MDWLTLPPLASLRAFAAFAETGSVVAAGQALNISHAAISQHLRGLETRLGTTLLDRSGRALALTEQGQRLADALVLGFSAIGNAVQELSAADEQRPLHISTTPTFAALWLMPRLPDFRAKHPEIDLMLDPSAQLADLLPGGIDVALRYGDGNWSGLVAERLLAAPMVIVAAPSLLHGRRVDSPDDLAELPWLEELGTTESGRWLRANGVHRGVVGGRIQVPGNLLLDGARDGQGVAVMVRQFVEPDLRAGRLVALFTEDSPAGYHIVTRPGVMRTPARVFLRWLRHQRG
ncbi:LysR family transcriptional regulator [Sedimentitalea nanhaiensis]|uniref:LysR family transcriptional regulator, glycine cleavage system transcriptional activator n=1 Tax=Sedimentitalea nanhaiensis TaxID=999627 RepID=A0A1I6XFQ4_9RHOB|nr:LysR family transcriptional regulator [Sedimentitalea nanhaiensis]SFT36872.1 LysR family transcriptional regulator, glycine cleavage system transcriptional activator [Sedimentitalea nanhaiensis]